MNRVMTTRLTEIAVTFEKLYKAVVIRFKKIKDTLRTNEEIVEVSAIIGGLKDRAVLLESLGLIQQFKGYPSTLGEMLGILKTKAEQNDINSKKRG